MITLLCFTNGDYSVTALTLESVEPVAAEFVGLVLGINDWFNDYSSTCGYSSILSSLSIIFWFDFLRLYYAFISVSVYLPL